MKVLSRQVLVVGGGAAGLNAALNLNSKDVLLLEMPGSNSLLSPWNLMVKPKSVLRKKMLMVGNGMNDKKLVDVFLNNIDGAVQDLKNLGIRLRESNIGLIPDYQAPGQVVRKIFLKKVKDKGVKILKGKVKKFLIDKKGEIKGVKAFLLNSEEVNIFFNYLILSSGGLSGFFKFHTGSADCDGSILSLCYETGLQIRDLEFFMFHPFLIIDKRFPKSLLSGDILTNMKYEDERGKAFLSKEVTEALSTNTHHYIFPKMTREFYLQSLKSKIFGRLVCSDKWFEQFKKENEFGFLFRNFKKSEIKKIELHPAFHFLIGGLVIDQESRTCQENVYAAGEITGGLHGSNRIGGLAVLEALVFGKIAASRVNKKVEKNKAEVLVPSDIKEVGNLGFTESIKDKAWESLGPVKRKEDLKELKLFLDNKKNLTSQEKLLKKIVDISLLRKESVGAFWRECLPLKKRAESSFLIKQNIVFQ